MSHWPEGVPPKADLRERLLREHPWLADERFGPRNVTAGDCDRCGAEPRLVLTCGPGGGEYGRRCAREDDWCDGHAAEAAAALDWLAALPDDADDIAYLWWLSTGEVRATPRLPDPVILATLSAPTRREGHQDHEKSPLGRGSATGAATES